MPFHHEHDPLIAVILRIISDWLSRPKKKRRRSRRAW
jgi:hypothetical protein